MADPQTHLDELENALRRLDHQWEAASEVWRDNVHREFAERYWQQLLRQHGMTGKSAGELANVLIQTRRTIN